MRDDADMQRADGRGHDALADALRRDAAIETPGGALRARTLRAAFAAERDPGALAPWSRWAMWAGAGLLTAALGVALLPRGAEPTTTFNPVAATERIALIRTTLETGARSIPARMEKPFRDEARRLAEGARLAAERALNPWRPAPAPEPGAPPEQPAPAPM